MLSAMLLELVLSLTSVNGQSMWRPSSVRHPANPNLACRSAWLKFLASSMHLIHSIQPPHGHVASGIEAICGAYAARCIDSYIEKRQKAAEDNSSPEVDSRLTAIVERMFDR